MTGERRRLRRLAAHCRRGGNTVQPRLLPIHQASKFTAAVSGAGTAQAREMDGVLHPVKSGGPVARLISALVDPMRLTAVPEHLRHERHVVEGATLVKRAEDFGGTPYANEFPRPQIEDISPVQSVQRPR